MSVKKLFFYKHAKSSAAVATLALHALFAILAVSFVAVTVIVKKDASFESKQVKRPKMQLRKLQVPVNISKKAPKPKLRKRIVVIPKVELNTPEIKLPEITGIKGGIGSAGSGGLGSGSSIGFTMPTFELFGIKAKGEKVFLILDAQGYIMVDDYGGIPAYNVLKSELLRIVGELDKTALFNICIFDGPIAAVAFKKMVPASSSNLEKATKWLEPLNTVKASDGGFKFGFATLGPGGHRLENVYEIEPLRVPPRGPTMSLLCSMQQQADTVFYLTNGNGPPAYEVEAADAWDPSDQRKWEAAIEKAKKRLEEENKDRIKKGLPPRVLPGKSLVLHYYPNTPVPPEGVSRKYTAEEMTEAMLNTRKKWARNDQQMKSGLSKSKLKKQFSFNAIQIVKKDYQGTGAGSYLDIFTKMNNGKFRTLVGLDAIHYTSTEED